MLKLVHLYHASNYIIPASHYLAFIHVHSFLGLHAGPPSSYSYAFLHMRKLTSICEDCEKKYAKMTIMPKLSRPKIFSDITNVQNVSYIATGSLSILTIMSDEDQ